jgi:carboxymethylenebutenolidase
VLIELLPKHLGLNVLEPVGLQRKAPSLTTFVTDQRMKAGYVWPAFEAALKSAGVSHEMHTYPGTQHGFHNTALQRGGSQARLGAHGAFFRKHLA